MFPFYTPEKGWGSGEGGVPPREGGCSSGVFEPFTICSLVKGYIVA